ncbi:hypothetical protein [Luteitalea sp. TBR-22]|uniref:hypothetical protein n=1 Tax=Luteitalea sp. TBR-22 TaxID=2802971 RepID=UPI001EF6FB3D|nr:hypothetical protein [Luteitalea sp. TBR-22]
MFLALAGWWAYDYYAAHIATIEPSSISASLETTSAESHVAPTASAPADAAPVDQKPAEPTTFSTGNMEEALRVLGSDPTPESLQAVTGALGQLTLPLQGDSGAARALNTRALALSNAEMYASAVPLLAEAAAVDPRDAEIRENYAYVLWRSGDPVRARGFAMDSVMLAPSRASAWANLGHVLALDGEGDAALGCYKAAFILSANPDNTIEFFRKRLEVETAPQLLQAITRFLERHDATLAATPVPASDPAVP